MFDVARAVALAWALYVTRGRWLATLSLVGVAYAFGLALASGLLLRAAGPQEPMMALLFILSGPTAVPRNELPHLPFAALVVHFPIVTGFVAAALPLVAAWSAAAALRTTPPASSENERGQRAVLALLVVVGAEVLSAGTQAVLYALDVANPF